MSSPDISQLTPAQQEALQTYTAVTDQDPISAIPLLQRCEWNVQIAIARFFDGEPATDPLAEARSALPPASSRQTANLQFESLLSSTHPPRPRAHPEDIVERVDTTPSTETQYRPSILFSILFSPVNVMYRVISAILSPLSFLVPSFLSRLLHRLVYQQSRPTRRSLPPAETTRRFIREFSEEYGTNALPFSESGFNLTLDTAKKDLKFLLVVLLSPSHDDNTTWVQETLLSSPMKSCLDSHKDELLLWGGNVQDAEAYQVSSSLQCTKFPFVALVCQTTEAGSSAMTVVMRAAGPMPASELVAKLGTAMTAHQAQLAAARAQRAEQQASRNLRQEQDSAYERSLAQDRERARQRREAEAAAARAEREAQERAEALAMRKANMEQWRQWRAQSLPKEPGPEVKDAIRVSIRMASGERIIRKFHSEADLDELYAFVDCYEILKAREAGDLTGTEVEEPTDYEHEYGFRLVSPMPRTVFDLEQGGSVGERIGRAANLLVEPIEEDDEGSDEE
ncbi:UBX domain-containing protein 10 [Exophiala dermatitidis]